MLAVRIDDLGKRYRLGARREPYQTLRERLAGLARARSSCGDARSASEEFWALRHVSLEVEHGEVFGIIGRNGAGKSTLLKILSRITEPSEGWAEIGGRVGSLLEVGTGFHPELSGRENIYLNGAILGMRKAEIDRRFDEIVSFAEVDEFIDTPVKRYSSGMYVRLAFAVAAHLEPEILVVDEVLAVGDAEFQRKCLGRMHDVARGGRTVLFVSHNMAAIRRLCRKVVVLDRGRVERLSDDPADAVRAYLAAGESAFPAWTREPADRPDGAHFRSAEIGNGRPPNAKDGIPITIVWELPSRAPDLYLGLGIYADDGTPLFGTQPEDAGIPTPREPGTYSATVLVPGELLAPGAYRLSLALWSQSHGPVDVREHALRFEVQDAPCLFNSVLPSRAGHLQVRCSWSIEAER
jgi:lipopolysaccharide transport system ATP-binding protein